MSVDPWNHKLFSIVAFIKEAIFTPVFFEPFSSLSHLGGAVVFAGLSILLLRQGRGDWLRMTSLAIFCFGTVFLLTVSGIFHLLDPQNAARPIVRQIDHAAIFFLIASSFTPAHIILFRDWGRWGVLFIIWAYAAAAIAMKLFYFNQLPQPLSLALYLTMGWMGLYTGVSVWRRHGFNAMQFLLWGGLAYTVGGILEWRHWPVVIPGVIQWHEVFHIFVLLGLGFHWAFTYNIANGQLAPIPSETAFVGFRRGAKS